MTTFRRTAVALAAAAFLAAPVSAAEMKIAFVNTPKVLEEAPQGKAARDKLQGEFSARDQELVAAQKRLKEMEDKLNRDSAVMSEPERRKLERDIVAERREFKRARDEFGEDLNIRRNEELAKLQRKVGQAIIDLAKENGYDLILEAGVVYASEKADITSQVVQRLNQLPTAGK